jgi:hypothetical protein
MGMLVFVCPATGREVHTGLEIDRATFISLTGQKHEVRCPHCPEPHHTTEILTWLSEATGKTRSVA